MKKIDINYLGYVNEVGLNTAKIVVTNLTNLVKLQVGRLILINIGSSYVVGIVKKISFIETIIQEPYLEDNEECVANNEVTINTGAIETILLGTIVGEEFKKHITSTPSVKDECFILEDETFKQIFTSEELKPNQLTVGQYSSYGGNALLDGNKLFQRHCAILGSSGSGKSWLVSMLCEKASQLASSNIVIFDIHGEYASLDYAKQLIIPGPDEVNSSDPNNLFLPYWLLSSTELISMFIDRSEYSAINQISIFQKLILEQKRRYIKEIDPDSVLLNSLTINSPVPFDIGIVIEKLKEINCQMISGAKSLKQGPHFGKFSKVISRISEKLKDTRYKFLFSTDSNHYEMSTLEHVINQVLSIKDSKIKTINFSEVPSEILPTIIALIARLIFQVQLWTDRDKRQPVAIIADECHLYLPANKSASTERSIDAFEKIAKEGRKFALVMIPVSQRPAEINDTVLAQMENIITLKISNPKDQAVISKLLPESFSGILENLPILQVGEAFVLGNCTDIPARIKLDAPRCEPLSSTIDFWSRWSKESDAVDFNEIVENMRRQGKK